MASLPNTPSPVRPTVFALGAATLLIGLLKTARPEALARSAGMPQASAVRTVGLQEMASGAGLMLSGPSKRWMASIGLSLLGQLAVLLKARPATRRQWRGLAFSYGVVLGLAAANLYAAQKLVRHED